MIPLRTIFAEKVDVRTLPDEQIERMLRVVEEMLLNMERTDEEMAVTDDQLTGAKLNIKNQCIKTRKPGGFMQSYCTLPDDLGTTRE